MANLGLGESMEKRDNEYELPAAAAILGVSIDKLQQLIQRGEVEAIDYNGTKTISKKTIAELFGKISETQDEPEAAKVKENVPADKKKRSKKTTLPKGAISLEDEPIAENDTDSQRKIVENEVRGKIRSLYRDREAIHQRIGSMLDHIEKLNYKVAYLKKIEEGRLAEFWQTVSSLFREVNHKTNFAVGEVNDKLYIYQGEGEASDKSPNTLIQQLINRIKKAGLPTQISDAMIAGIQNGQLPPPRVIKDLGLDPDDYNKLRFGEQEEEE